MSSNVIKGAGTSPPYAIYLKNQIQSRLTMIKHIDNSLQICKTMRIGSAFWSKAQALGKAKNIQRTVIFRTQDDKLCLTGICFCISSKTYSEQKRDYRPLL